jgi:esterase/lipase superfamily enzyme
MKFIKDSYLDYCLIDLTEEKGRDVRADEGYFVYNSEAINEKLSHHIIFVHGYNTDFFDAMETASCYYGILRPLRRYEENSLAVYWSGKTGIDFSKAVMQADKTALNLASTINYIVKNSLTPNPSITFIAHSLGNRVCAQTILALKSKYNINPVKNFIQLAPAINANAYEADFKDVPSLVDNIVVYHSKKDKVLNEIYEDWNKFRNLKDGNKYEALGTFGPYGVRPKTVQVIDSNTIAGINVEHGTYLSNQKLIESVAQFILMPDAGTKKSILDKVFTFFKP